jgi:hypothetical protein
MYLKAASNNNIPTSSSAPRSRSRSNAIHLNNIFCSITRLAGTGLRKEEDNTETTAELQEHDLLNTKWALKANSRLRSA